MASQTEWCVERFGDGEVAGMMRSAARLQSRSSISWRVLTACVFAAALLSVQSLTGAEPQRKNVLFIAIDDLRTELGCYGLDYVHSPNLDRLAGQGVLFTNHFVQVPTCGASRYALLTGRNPASSGVTSNNAALYQGASRIRSEQTPGAQTLPELFRRSGYETVSIGKISHTADGRVFAYNGSGDGREEVPLAWSRYATPLGQWKRGWGIFFAYANGRHREDGQGNHDLMEFVVDDDDDLPDGLLARSAITELKRFAENRQPFFLGVGFFKPHLPFVAPRRDWEALQQVQVPPPPHPEVVDSPYWHNSGEFYKYAMPLQKTRPMSTPDQITARRAYLACVRYVDRQVGRVLQALDETGLSESTIVVVWGDHGWHLGDSAIWGKHAPFERALNSTLMIRSPGISRPGRRSDALVETVDLFPTLVELCQPTFRQTEYPLDGVSLVPVLDGSRDSVREAAISYWRSAVSVRTREYRLIRPRQSDSDARGVELYRTADGPDPIQNLAGSHPELVEQLSRHIPTK